MAQNFTMSRYFIEVCYQGANYAGFQIQENANSIQAEVEKALSLFFRSNFALTGSSRTDTGVHALQNFFHLDTDIFPISPILNKAIYNINAILPNDIVVKRIFQVPDTMHCRFDAIHREYHYYIYQQKDPFEQHKAYFYPYPLNLQLLNQAAQLLINYKDFSSFSKKNTQVKSFICNITESKWEQNQTTFTYTVKSNRFLRGMVRGLVGTMLNLGTGKLSIEQFIEIIELQNPAKTNFAVPPQGLFLVNVKYPSIQ